jgi:hypothetical protein
MATHPIPFLAVSPNATGEGCKAALDFLFTGLELPMLPFYLLTMLLG